MNLLTDNGYLRGAALAIKEEKWFKADFIMSFFSIFVKAYLCFALFRAVFLNTPGVNANEITLYFIIVRIVSMSIDAAQSVAYEHMEIINSGAIIPYLLRPTSYIASNYLNTLVSSAMRLMVNMIFILFASCIMGQQIGLKPFAVGLLSSLLGFTILYLIQAIIGCCSVWFHDITRFRDVIYSLLMLFGGRLLPSDLLFSGIKRIVYYTPLPYVYDVPTKALMGNDTVTMIYIQLIWVALFGGAYIYLFERYVKNNIEFGG